MEEQGRALTGEQWARVRDRVRAIVETRPEPARHAARNAVRFADKALQLKDVDPEMALFRAITAEEEAATAIFRALQRLRYAGAESLDVRSHVHKAAVRPFLEAVGRALSTSADLMGVELAYHVQPEPGDRISISLRIPALGRQLIVPTPPLGFEMTLNDAPHQFREELVAGLTLECASQIPQALRARANQRNRLLYAVPEGIPGVKEVGSGVERWRDAVYGLLVVYLLIDQCEEHQLFVKQLLPCFVALVSEAQRVPLRAALSSNTLR